MNGWRGFTRGAIARTVVTVGAAVGVTGCAHPYVMPAVHEPHASVTLVRLTQARPGERIRQNVEVDGETLLAADRAAWPKPATDQVRLEPGLVELHASSLRYRRELRSYWESYGTRYAWGGGYCGVRPCFVDPYPMLVTRIVDVPVARCEVTRNLFVERGANYRVRLVHGAHGTCTLECRELLSGGRERACVKVVERVVD